MATAESIARGLALLHESFPTRGISAETGKAWALIFDGVSDKDFLSACLTAARTPGRTFFPTTGELMGLAAPTPQVNAEAVLLEIQALATYRPTGMLWPMVELVSDTFGGHIASAYAAAGSARVFSDNPTTREIAQREFAKALQEPFHDVDRRFLLSPSDQPLLKAGA